MVVDKSGSFVGASIGPGVGISLRALSGGTAQLPHISLEAPKSVLGKNTADCMRSGVIFGNAAMLDGMIDRFYEELGEELPVLATGGLSAIIVPYCRHKITPDANLVLKGLYLLYQKNKIED
ncbi:MAG: type III pantothenate kinase, partial [Clostridia bacterium]|nr:type III pantothenate kinase [Clostridia bacterium]